MLIHFDGDNLKIMLLQTLLAAGKSVVLDVLTEDDLFRGVLLTAAHLGPGPASFAGVLPNMESVRFHLRDVEYARVMRIF